MPRHRPPREVWEHLRRRVWERDAGMCQRCGVAVAFDQFHCDHIHSGRLGTNRLSNLRSLCRRCHVLRSDPRHRGMIASALNDGVIPANWRELTWDD